MNNILTLIIFSQIYHESFNIHRFCKFVEILLKVKILNFLNVNRSILFFAGTPYMLKYLSLIALTAQNAMVILVMRYVRTRGGEMFMATSAVVMSEVLKFTSCLLIIFYQQGSVRRWLHHLHENIIMQPGLYLFYYTPAGTCI